MSLAISLALIAGLLWAISNVIDKVALSKYIKNPLIVTPIVGLVSFLFGFFILVQNNQVLPSQIIWKIIGLSTLLFLAIISYFIAVKHEEISRIIPIYGLSPALMALLEFFFFGTMLATLQYFGIAAAVLGVVLITYGSATTKINKKGLTFILIGTLLWSFTFMYLARIFNEYGYWKALGWEQFTIGVLGLLSLLLVKREFFESMKANSQKAFYLIFTSEVFGTAAGAIGFYAASLWAASLTSAVASDQYILVFLISLFITKKWPQLFEEKVGPKIIIQKTISILLIIAGIFLISL